MKVYVIIFSTESCPTCGTDEVIAVFNTEAKAKEFIEEKNKTVRNIALDEYFYSEYEVI